MRLSTRLLLELASYHPKQCTSPETRKGMATFRREQRKKLGRYGAAWYLAGLCASSKTV